MCICIHPDRQTGRPTHHTLLYGVSIHSSIRLSICAALSAPCTHITHTWQCVFHSRGPSTHTRQTDRQTHRQTDRQLRCSQSFLPTFWFPGAVGGFLSSYRIGRGCCMALGHVHTPPHTRAIRPSPPDLLAVAVVHGDGKAGRLAACGACVLLCVHLCCLIA